MLQHHQAFRLKLSRNQLLSWQQAQGVHNVLRFFFPGIQIYGSQDRFDGIGNDFSSSASIATIVDESL